MNRCNLILSHPLSDVFIVSQPVAFMSIYLHLTMLLGVWYWNWFNLKTGVVWATNELTLRLFQFFTFYWVLGTEKFFSFFPFFSCFMFSPGLWGLVNSLHEGKSKIKSGKNVVSLKNYIKIQQVYMNVAWKNVEAINSDEWCFVAWSMLRWFYLIPGQTYRDLYSLAFVVASRCVAKHAENI